MIKQYHLSPRGNYALWLVGGTFHGGRSSELTHFKKFTIREIKYHLRKIRNGERKKGARGKQTTNPQGKDAERDERAGRKGESEKARVEVKKD